MKRLYRSETDKIVAGVCGGLGAHLRVDPVILRVLFVAAALANGVGIIIYFLAWVLLPAEDKVLFDREAFDHEQVMRENIAEIRARANELGDEARQKLGGPAERASGGMLMVGAALVGFGLLALLRNLGMLTWLVRLWPLALIAVGVVLFINNLKDKS